MRVRTITIGGVVLGLVLACALPVEDKTGCRSSTDCVDGRVCIDGQCNDGACEWWCVEVCDAVSDCEAATTADCESRCVVGDAGPPPLVPALTASECRDLYDRWSDDDECDELGCVRACTAICELAASCELIVDVSTCFLGCVAADDSCSMSPDDCVSVPADVLCWEDADLCQ